VHPLNGLLLSFDAIVVDIHMAEMNILANPVKLPSNLPNNKINILVLYYFNVLLRIIFT